MHESDIYLLTNSDRMARLWMVDGKIVVRIPVVMTAFFIFPKAPRPVMRPSLPSLQRVLDLCTRVEAAKA